MKKKTKKTKKKEKMTSFSAVFFSFLSSFSTCLTSSRPLAIDSVRQGGLGPLQEGREEKSMEGENHCVSVAVY